jgi:trimethylamine--corrinoid protein Co-methyltransferase
MDGIAVSDETLALDVIREVGPAGNYLTHKHTRTHMRELWRPTLMDRRPYGAWEEKRDGAREWARDKARDILKKHRPDPLDPKLAAELARIIASVERTSE